MPRIAPDTIKPDLDRIRSKTGVKQDIGVPEDDAPMLRSVWSIIERAHANRRDMDVFRVGVSFSEPELMAMRRLLARIGMPA